MGGGGGGLMACCGAPAPRRRPHLVMQALDAALALLLLHEDGIDVARRLLVAPLECRVVLDDLARIRARARLVHREVVVREVALEGPHLLDQPLVLALELRHEA